MGKEPTDMKTYSEINDKLSEQQKESLMTASLDSIKDSISAVDIDTTSIYNSVDQVESMIAGDGSDSGIHGRLDTIHADLAALQLDIDGLQTAVVNAINQAKTAIVDAINSH